MGFLLFVLCGLWTGTLLSPLRAPQQARVIVSTTPPVELKISGPGIIQEGEEVRFKVVVISRSPDPIIISDRGSGNMWSSFSWHVVDAEGEGVPTAPIDPKKILVDDMGGPLNDREVHVLEPGQKLVYKRASDPTVSACYPTLDKMECMQKRVFPGKGTYRIWLHYQFSPNGEADYTDTFIKAPTLSPANIEVLKRTFLVDVNSNEWLIRLQ